VVSRIENWASVFKRQNLIYNYQDNTQDQWPVKTDAFTKREAWGAFGERETKKSV